MTEIQCIFCGNSAQESDDGFYISKDIHSIECKVCGKYKITYEAYEDFPNTKRILNDNNRWIYSGYIREMTENKGELGIITRDNYMQILNSSLIPKTIYKKRDKLLWYLYRKTNEEYFGREIEFNYENDYSILYAKNEKEAIHIVSQYEDEMYIWKVPYADDKKCFLILNADAIEYIQEQQKNNQSDQGFVAMWFDPHLEDMFSIIQKTVKEKTKYRLLRIDFVEHNDDITDKIIAEIRRSKFLVADFTGDRGGVYYEAGFAHGLGKEVIFTCRKDYFCNERKPHFDIEHRSFILWETPEQLAEKLVDRIRATII